LEIEFGGKDPGSQYDQLIVDGLLKLGGNLSIELIDGFRPSVGDAFEILAFEEVSGAFQSVVLPDGISGELTYEPASIVFTVSAVPEPSTLWCLAIGACCLAGRRIAAPHWSRRQASV
ncbi:MAG: PEP-CTERM sorting domain-containing protein, partial [Planctomycetota bacterium]